MVYYFLQNNNLLHHAKGKVVTVESGFPFLSVNKTKSAIADTMFRQNIAYFLIIAFSVFHTKIPDTKK
jgi:hypothetical protein